LRGDNIVKKLSLHLFQISGGEGTRDLYIVGNGEEEKEEEEEEEEESGEEVNGGAFKDSRERSFASVVEEEDPGSFVCALWGWSGRDGGVCACALVMGAARKMVVEVTSARGLMPKDGQGSANPYCVVSAGTWMRDVVAFLLSLLAGVTGPFPFLVRERERGVNLVSLLQSMSPAAGL
jgi:hypothetical protein